MLLLQYWWLLLIGGLAVYLLSNVNFAIIFSKRIAHKDIRSLGSGNPGTTNVVRNFGLSMGLLTFVCDMCKGIIAAVFGKYLIFAISGLVDVADFAAMFFGMCAILGHIYPVFLRFKGGKGVAASLGFFLVVNPIVTSLSLVLAVALILIFDKVSIFALFHITLQLVWGICAAFTNTLYTEISTSIAISCCLFVMWAVIIFEHRANIVSLLKGTERNSGIRKIFIRKKNEEKSETIENAETEHV